MHAVPSAQEIRMVPGRLEAHANSSGHISGSSTLQFSSAPESTNLDTDPRLGMNLRACSTKIPIKASQ